MPGPWNDATDRQLLLTVIHLTAPQLPKWDQVAELMGPAFTADSTRQHFQKLRKDCKARFGEPGSAKKSGGASSMKAAVTPRKRKDVQDDDETPAKSTVKREGGKAAKEVDCDDEENQSPTKKMKVEDDDGDVFAVLN